MRLSALLFAGAVAAAAISQQEEAKAQYNGPEIWGSYNDIEECDMHQAIECLQTQICGRRKLPLPSKIRCTIGGAVAYMCNYRTRGDEGASCSHEEIYEAWRQIRIGRGSRTGWWYDSQRQRTYGLDRSCRSHEWYVCPNALIFFFFFDERNLLTQCQHSDNGWKEGSIGEQCTNINKPHLPWLFDYIGPTYPNFTANFIQDLPDPEDKTEPVYFNPWEEGRRPT